MTRPLWLEYLALFGGLTYLLIGGDFLVRGAIGMSRRAELPPMLVGLTVVAFGTSAPELVISMFSALEGHAALAIGNIIGSNIANVLLVLGVPVLIYPAAAEPGVARHAGFMVAISVLFVALCFTGSLGRLEGMIMLALLASGLFLAVRGRAEMPGFDAEEVEDELNRVLGMPNTIPKILTLVIVGTLALPLGADLTVDAGVEISMQLGVPEAVIGCSLLAIGTSLPELSTTVIAALHRSSGVALGNVIGSNVMNILAIMGITAMIVEVPVPANLLAFDVWVMLLCAVVLWLYMLKARQIGRPTGIVFLVGYVSYLFALFR